MARRLAFVACFALLCAGDARAAPAFQGTQSPLPDALIARMRQFSWHEGCPTPMAQLVLLRLNHYGYDGAIHQGELIVHADVAEEVLAIFASLFQQRFAIEKMRPIDAYQGRDDASMADNNTSGFNCRFVQGKPGAFSKHSHGRAVDINPLTNPMVVGERVFPPAGATFLRRRKRVTGMLRANSQAVEAFTRRGWTWGGSWSSLKDYQHFEK